MIRTENLTIRYGSFTVLDNLNIEIKDKEIVGIIGPSGSGKSLLLRCLMMLDKPSSGKIYLDEDEMTARHADIVKFRQRIGLVFQTFNLFDHLSAVENVMSGLVHLKKQEAKQAFEKSMTLLRSVGMADKAFASPATLSGGQKQRVAIARTLAMDPDIIFLDEPTSALDPSMTGEVEAVIRMMAAQGHTMVIVSHDMELIRQIATRVIFLKDKQVYEEGAPEDIFENPKRTGTRRFIKALRVLEFDIHSKDFDFIGMQTYINDFAFRNGINHKNVLKMQAVMEELSQMVIIQPKEENIMHASFEYNRKLEVITGVVRFTGPDFDPDDPHYFISWPLIQMYAKEVSYGHLTEGSYNNSINLTF